MSILENKGFGFSEHMAGSYRRKDSSSSSLPGGKFHFDLEVDCRDLSRPVDITGDMRGKVTMEGVADDAPAEGTIEISPLWKRRIRYAFSFTGNDGRRYRFDGKKSIRVRGLLGSWTTLPGQVFDDTGRAIADVVARFDLRRDLGRLVKSVRRPA